MNCHQSEKHLTALSVLISLFQKKQLMAMRQAEEKGLFWGI
jgi:hypothetical protein